MSGARQLAGFARRLCQAKTAAYTVTKADVASVLLVSGTWTLGLPAVASVSNGFTVTVRNNGSGIITIDPSGAETVNGLATLAIGPSTIDLICDGTGWQALFSDGRQAVIGERVAGQFVSLPALCVWANGQNLSRTTYALLLAATTVACTTYTTNASTAAQIAIAATTLDEAISVGMPIEGAGIQAGTTVLAITFVSGTTYNVTLSLAANAGQSGGAGRIFPNGNGNGSTTFGVADYRDRAAVARGNLGGGAAAGRLTGGVSGITSSRLGASGGNQSPSPQTQIGRFGTPNGAGVTWLDFVPGDTASYGSSADAATNGTGASGNVQPSIIENVALYAGA